MPEEKKDIKQIIKPKAPVFRTLETDTTDYIKEKEISLVDIATQQARYSQGFASNGNGSQSFKKYIIAITAILIIGLGAGAIIWFFLRGGNDVVSTIAPLPKPFILSDSEKEVVVDFSSFLNQKEKIREALYLSFVPTEKTRFIYLPIITESPTGKALIKSRDFLKLFNIELPIVLSESTSDRFMLVDFQSDKNWPVLILGINDYENAFGAMLKWENKLDIFNEFRSLFDYDGGLRVDSFFQDKELRNRDTRILYSSDGIPVFLYAFINQDYIAITNNQAAMEETLRRFSLSQYLLN